ncbi:unnamed protein product [Schistocephalus solidus]|uniref:Reverse transcriptase domain-containing protein n=1 Tax=Schistocephalus solidus TaxID=70667 RepID=A0A183TDA6_SCHSO|nr:unnamed protein product [Schistocephalus solidus]
MQASARVSTTTVKELLFADDCALNTVTGEDIQRSMDLFTAGCANFGLTISTAKTVVMHQPTPSAEYNDPLINVNGAQHKMWKPLLIWEARPHATRESMGRLPNGSLKLVKPSADCKPPCGIATVFT